MEPIMPDMDTGIVNLENLRINHLYNVLAHTITESFESVRGVEATGPFTEQTLIHSRPQGVNSSLLSLIGSYEVVDHEHYNEKRAAYQKITVKLPLFSAPSATTKIKATLNLNPADMPVYSDNNRSPIPISHRYP
jgi:hypothetical protein